MAKKKINKIKKHEGMYIHISKRWLWIFSPLCLIVPLIYIVYIILVAVFNLMGFIIGSIFVPMVEMKDAKYFWTLKKETFKNISPKWFNEF